MSAPLHRCLAVWLTATAVAAGLGLVLVPVALAPAAAFDELLVRTCAVLGTLLVAWLWLVTTVVAVEARRGRSRMPVPRGVRRLLLAACGVAVLAGLATPAAAAAAPRGDTPRTAVAVVADALSGLPLPDRPHGRDRSRPAPQGAQVTVQAGDSLWTLAEEHLGSGERWPEIYALNRAVVGGDPDVIAPAQRLRLPVKEK